MKTPSHDQLRQSVEDAFITANAETELLKSQLAVLDEKFKNGELVVDDYIALKQALETRLELMKSSQTTFSDLFAVLSMGK